MTLHLGGKAWADAHLPDDVAAHLGNLSLDKYQPIKNFS